MPSATPKSAGKATTVSARGASTPHELVWKDLPLEEQHRLIQSGTSAEKLPHRRRVCETPLDERNALDHALLYDGSARVNCEQIVKDDDARIAQAKVAAAAATPTQSLGIGAIIGIVIGVVVLVVVVVVIAVVVWRRRRRKE